LKVLAGLQSMPTNRFSELLRTIKPADWARDGRSFVRREFVFDPV
jgi:hypothetical protein